MMKAEKNILLSKTRFVGGKRTQEIDMFAGGHAQETVIPKARFM
jgi:hypothetical protein